MFRFTIRDMLWLTVVVALAVVCVRDRAMLAARSSAGRELVENIKAHLSTDGKLEMDVSVVNKDGKLWVLPTYGDGRGSNGELLGVIPGGHAGFVLSSNGEVTAFFGGR